MIFPNAIGFLIISIVSLALCAIGFKKLVWFMSIGYGIATAGIGLTLLIMSLISGNISFLYIIQCLLLLVYGVRLGGFLLIRELKNEKYKAKLNEIGANTKVPFFVAFVIWIVCAALYVCQTSPAIYRLQNGFSKTTDIAFIIGLVISLAGIIIETVADKQKSAQKEKNPNLSTSYRQARSEIVKVISTIDSASENIRSALKKITKYQKQMQELVQELETTKIASNSTFVISDFLIQFNDYKK